MVVRSVAVLHREGASLARGIEWDARRRVSTFQSFSANVFALDTHCSWS